MWLPHANTTVEVLDGGNWNGAQVTSGGSANTKGSYATIGTTSRRYDGIMLGFIQPGGAPRLMLDVAIGAGNTIIVDNLFADTSGAATSRGGLNVFLPIRVPSGVDVKVRWQVNGGLNQVARCTILGFTYDGTPAPSFRRATLLNPFTSTTRVTSGTPPALNGGSPSTTGWQQAIASLANDVGGLILSPSSENAGQVNNNILRFDIGIGGAGSEIPIVQGHLAGTLTGGVTGFQPTFVPVTLAAGERISWRARGPNSATSGLGLGVMALER